MVIRTQQSHCWIEQQQQNYGKRYDKILRLMKREEPTSQANAL